MITVVVDRKTTIRFKSIQDLADWLADVMEAK